MHLYAHGVSSGTGQPEASHLLLQDSCFPGGLGLTQPFLVSRRQLFEITAEGAWTARSEISILR